MNSYMWSSRNTGISPVLARPKRYGHMVSITEKPISESEASSLVAHATSTSHRLGAIIALYGSYLILIPVIGGGMIGGVLRIIFRQNPDLAYGIGLSMATIISFFMFVKFQSSNAMSRKSITQKAAFAQQEKKLRVIEFEVEAVWDVVDIDDRIKFLCRTPDNQFVFLVADWLDDPEFFPGRRVRIEILPHVESITNAEAQGQPLKKSNKRALLRSFLPVAESDDWAVFSEEKLSQKVRKILQESN